MNELKNTTAPWQIYRTRFLIKAKPLTEPLSFVDALGRQHRGQPGDYLIESSDGNRSIQRRDIFEDVYVPMGPAGGTPPPCSGGLAALEAKHNGVTHSAALA
jgi:hypothetical protein